jgi:hypothetical protein
MSTLVDAPLLIGILVGGLAVLVGWGFLRTIYKEALADVFYGNDGLLLGFMIFAAFALGVFLTFFVIIH